MKRKKWHQILKFPVIMNIKSKAWQFIPMAVTIYILRKLTKKKLNSMLGLLYELAFVLANYGILVVHMYLICIPPLFCHKFFELLCHALASWMSYMYAQLLVRFWQNVKKNWCTNGDIPQNMSNLLWSPNHPSLFPLLV